MHPPPFGAVIDADPLIPFTDEEIGSAAHEKHMPSVRAIAVDPDRGLVLLNLIGADTSVSAVIMELLRSKSNGVGFMPSRFAQGSRIPTQLTIQHGIRYTTFRSALATPGGSISQKNWCLLITTANIAESRRRAPIIPTQLLPPPPPATGDTALAVPADTPPVALPPHYVIGTATATTPDPHALLGHLRAIGVVVADGWAESVRDLACEQQLVTPTPAAGVTCWRVDGDLVRWVALITHGIQSNRFPIPATVMRQQRAT
jgi:hypothetical protein